jgi:photosystem II stability/assembly factor-like uncharacterized protein
LSVVSVFASAQKLAADEQPYADYYEGSVSSEMPQDFELNRTTDLPETPWMSGGPYGAPLRQVAVSPAYSEDHTVFAGTWGSGVFRLNDNLGVWESRSAGLNPPRTMDLVISPDFANDGTLFVALHGGKVYSTTDEGMSWNLADTGLPWRSIRALAISPNYKEDGTVYAGLNGSGVYRTENRGQRWVSMTTGMPVTTVVALAIHPQFTTTSQLYALTEGEALYRSDNGASWSPCTPLPYGYSPRAMAYTPDGGTLFVASCYGLYYSDDGCISWQAVEGIASIRMLLDKVIISPDFDTDQTLWVSNQHDGKLLRSTDAGATWVQVTSAISHPIGLAISPAFHEDGTLFIGDLSGYGGVYRSTDRGDTWATRSTGMTWRVISLATSPDYQRDKTVFVGLNGGGAFRSENGGISWEPANAGYLPGADAEALALSPQYPQDKTVFAAGYGTGINRSENRGNTWSQVGMEDIYAITEIAIAPTETLTDALILVGTLKDGLYHSHDGGWTWKPITHGLVISRVNDIGFSPAYTDDQTVFVATDGSGIFRSEDAGETWMTVTQGIENPYIWALGISPNFTNDGTLIVSNCSGLSRSKDRGESWELLSSPEGYGVSEIVFSPNYQKDQTIWVATTEWSPDSTGGVFVSQDGGDSWHPFNEGLPQLSHYALAVGDAGDGGYDVLVGTGTRSVWQQRVTFSTNEWAVFVYLNTDNDHLDQHAPGLFNRLELAVSDHPSLTIRVLWDRIGEGNTVLYDVLPDDNKLLFASYEEGVKKWSLGELDLGDPLTLWEFIADARLAYPARYTLLAIVNHGGGWSPELRDPQRSSIRYAYGASGFSWDFTNNHNYLSTQDVGLIFNQDSLVSQPIDVVFYDACLMGMVEEAYEIRQGARYLVSSENETWSSFPYDAYLAGIEARTPSEQAAWMVDQYDASLVGYPRTLSAIDLQRTGALSTALDNLAIALFNATPAYSSVITSTLLAAQKFDYNADLVISDTEGYVDLGDFAARLTEVFPPGSDVSQAAIAVRDVLTDGSAPLIIHERHRSGPTRSPYYTYMDLSNATGLSIYLPLNESDGDLVFYRHDQLAFARDTHWDEFIYEFLDYAPGPVNPDWVGGRGHPVKPLNPTHVVFLPLILK